MIDIHTRQRPISADLVAAYGDLLGQIYANRGISSTQDLNYSLNQLTSYHSLKGIDKACQLLADAMATQSRLLIVGDYDCDGATSTSLGYLSLTAMGARHVEYLVPNRFTFGYGLSAPLVEAACAHQTIQDRPAIIITVDNGISSHAGIELAQSLGIKVIVTDHHLPGETLPTADCIINPNQPDCAFPHKSTAGVGVIFYVMSALRSYLHRQGWFQQQQIPPPNMAQYLDLVALGTVADLVPLTYNNRILVAQGIARMRQGQGRPGITALVACAGRHINQLLAQDLGFAVGPRLNAAGRMDDMSLGIQCLLAKTSATAEPLAQKLHALNQNRQEVQGAMQIEAEAIVAKTVTVTETTIKEQAALPNCFCLYQPNWHQGVVGIVASRLKERWHRPAIVFAQGDDGLLKGSARSIQGLHIRDALAAIDAAHPRLIERFGGHAMAAGLSLDATQYLDFKRALEAYMDSNLDKKLLAPTWYSDGCLTHEQINLYQAKQLKAAGPWGQGFNAPHFHGDFVLLQHRIVGEKHVKLVLTDDTAQTMVDAIHFNADLAQWPPPTDKMRLVYSLEVNRFRGKESVQLFVEAMQPLSLTN